MKTLKWVEIANPVSRDRLTFLSDFLGRHGIPNEVTFIEASRDDFKNKLEAAKKEFDEILVGSPFKEFSFDATGDLTATVQVVKAIDAWSKDRNGKWWPHSLLYEAFIHSLAHQIKTLDLNSTVLMVGAGGAARAVLTALVRVGFTKFNVTDRFQEKVQTMITDLKRTFFNIKFEYVPQSGITALPGMHSLVVNTTPLIEGNDLLFELQYYNFMKEGGAVIDLVQVPVKTPLLEEAEHIGAKIVRGLDVAAEVDAIWAKMACGFVLDIKTYSEGLEEVLTKIPFDLKPFRQQ